MRSHFYIFIFSLLFITSCFGSIEKRGSVKGYYNGVVRTDGGQFRVGTLPAYWKQKKIKFRALFFENQNDHSTITIDSFCRSAVDSGNLEDLTKKLLRSLKKVHIEQQKSEILSGREALQTVFTGYVDGNKILSDIYVLKMNECVFDFIYVSYPSDNNYQTDFLNLVKGFQFIEGPDPL